MKSFIQAVDYYLPENVLSNSRLVSEFPDWSMEKIEKKTGIVNRHISSSDECSSDLGVMAAQKLFLNNICLPEEIDYILFCTQSPDYFLPTTACLIQDRLGIPTTTGALDINLGCSGYIYGLGLAKGLIETDQANTILLITAETYSKFINPDDRSVRTIFGDGASATVIRGVEGDENWIGPFAYGTDGKGADNLIVKVGGMRNQIGKDNQPPTEIDNGKKFAKASLYMNGPEVFTFSIQSVPSIVNQLLSRSGCSIDAIDLFIFHQANQYMLEHLRKKLKIPSEKFIFALRDFGNTVSSTIPIALCEARRKGLVKTGQRIMLVGFGVGYSWSATLIKWIGM